MTTSKFNHIFWIIGFIGAITKEKPLLSQKKTIHDSKHSQRVFYNNLATSTTTTKKWGNTQNLALLHVTTYLVASIIPTLKTKWKMYQASLCQVSYMEWELMQKLTWWKSPMPMPLLEA